MLESDTPFAHGRDGEETWFGLLYGHETFVDKVDRALQAEHNLPLTWFEVLLRLVIENTSEDGFMSVSKIAGAVLLSPSRVSRVLDGLEQRGLLERRRGERDARVSEVALTQQGRDLCKAANTTHRRVVNEIFLEKLSAEEAEVIAGVWRRLLGKPGKTV